jgi:hypothetical protein
MVAVGSKVGGFNLIDQRFVCQPTAGPHLKIRKHDCSALSQRFISADGRADIALGALAGLQFSYR